MSHFQGLYPSENPDLYESIVHIQALFCILVNPCMHATELERCGLTCEPERRALKIRLEQELKQLLDRIPWPVPECFLSFINTELVIS
jgi:hypothetical protein